MCGSENLANITVLKGMMASSACTRPDVDQVQSALQTSLAKLGYDRSVGQLPSNLSQNEKLFNFVQFVTGKLDTDHHINPDELPKFQELKSAGAILEVCNSYSQSDL